MYLDDMNAPFWGGHIFKVNNDRSAQQTHFRNGGELWKAKNKRGGR